MVIRSRQNVMQIIDETLQQMFEQKHAIDVGTYKNRHTKSMMAILKQFYDRLRVKKLCKSRPLLQIIYSIIIYKIYVKLQHLQ